MKKRVKYFVFLIVAVTCFVWSCDDYLDVVPDNVPTIDHAFRDKVGAERFLFTCYSYLPRKGQVMGDPALLGADDVWSHEDENYQRFVMNFYEYRIKQGRQNSNEPLLNFWNGRLNGLNLYQGIRDCNVFLENIDKVGADLRTPERNLWKAEVTFLKAYYHYFLLRMYGPIPLIRENLPVSAGIEEVRVYREPFDDCVDYIVGLIDAVKDDLPLTIRDRTQDMGRITRPIALAIKAELLVMAASPLFNGNPDYAGLKDNREVFLFKAEEDPSKWERAAIACKEAIDLCAEASIRLYEFPETSYDLSETTRQVMTNRHVYLDKWNRELIWGYSRPNYATLWSVQFITIPYFTFNDVNRAQGYPILSPTLRMAELFYSKRGIPIEEDTEYDYENRFNTAVAPEDHKYYIQPGFETAILHMNREPRFYANLGFDGGVWFGNGRFNDIDKGTPAETSWVLQMKRGQPSGNVNGLRYSITGYYAKKLSHFESTRAADGSNLMITPTSYPIIRLADLYLLYAEALNETLGDNESPTKHPDIYFYVNEIRKRAGLEGVVESWAYSRISGKPSTKQGMREIIRQERMIELAFEGKRFWDIRRWKTASELMNQPIRGWNINGSTTADFYNVVTIESPSFTPKEYLWPIWDHELRTNKNLEPNPGWHN